MNYNCEFVNAINLQHMNFNDFG